MHCFILFINHLFNDSIRSLDSMASHSGMISE